MLFLIQGNEFLHRVCDAYTLSENAALVAMAIYDVIIIFRLLVGLKLAIFHFRPLKLKHIKLSSYILIAQ